METGDIQRVSCEELRQQLQGESKLALVDLRGQGSYTAGHIPGAVNITYDINSDPFERQIKFSALPQDTPIVLYCD